MRVDEFQPEWVSAPGDTIADILAERQLSVGDLARLINQDPSTAQALLEGRASITLAIARRLQTSLGGTVEFWMSRDFQYRSGVNRLEGEPQRWLRDLPIADMIKYGWLPEIPRPSEELDACLRFFGVKNLGAWHQRYAEVEQLANFRSSQAFESKPAAVAAWLRQGEIEAEAMTCDDWDPIKFRAVLQNIRGLTRQKNPEAFVPQLQKLCGQSGVAVVILRAPSGCRASGATCFLSDRKAMLLLSFRHLTDDQFWFTFFHEAAHLLLHSKTRLFVDASEMPSSSEEEEANTFAALTLVPSELQPTLLKLPLNTMEVIRFASKVGVSPGIIVGQMQHLGLISHNQLNRLKRRYHWVG